MKLTHGGDVFGFEERYGKKPLDFSVNLSPLGMPESVRRAASEAAGDAEAYPDPLYRRLRRAIAEKEGVPEAWVFPANGAAELFYRIAYALKPGEALVPVPSFGEYERALLGCGCSVHGFRLRDEKDYAIDSEFANFFRYGMDAVFLCQPNNPTGLLTEPEVLCELERSCAACGALLLVDECFLDFCENGEAYSMKGELARRKNLLIVKSFTKLYAMAGLRLGYLLSSNAELIEALYNSGQPWSISAPAEAAGLAALKETEYAKESVRLVGEERKKLYEGLSAMGFRVLDGKANYLFFNIDGERELADRLAERGIMVRRCGDFKGLSGTWLRIGIRLPEENMRLLSEIADIRAANRKEK